MKVLEITFSDESLLQQFQRIDKTVDKSSRNVRKYIFQNLCWAKIQTSMRFRAVWSFWIVKDGKIFLADNLAFARICKLI